jgi:transcriptional regulator with XRE-family HTH domain
MESNPQTGPRNQASKQARARAKAIDRHIGERIRIRRVQKGISQERLAAALGLTFQQVQKYERGINRVAGARLYDLGFELDVPVGFFFDDMPEELAHRLNLSPARFSGSGFAEAQEPFASDVTSKRDTLELMRAFNQLASAAQSKAIIDLVKSLALR